MAQRKRWDKAGLTEEEYGKIEEILERSPNELELNLYGVMWSEHCSYKHSRATLRNLPRDGENVLLGPGENAGVMDIGEGKAVAFKVESHNHPSAIEPYQGAATGVGGILRDIFAMGARPIALLNSLRFGLLSDKHVGYLFSGVVEGISGYGNCIGVPTVGGEVYFSSKYQGNPLVNVMAVGILDHEDLMTAKAREVGSTLILAGATTGRDGIQGASFASEMLQEDSHIDRPAVQVGDPFMEKLLLEATLELTKEGLLEAVQDLGAAGLTSSSCEMASRGGRGMEIDVLKVPCREEGMTPFEIMLSESQERMLFIPKKGREEEVLSLLNKWGLKASTIGRVTNDGLLTIWEGEAIRASVPASSLANGPLYFPGKVRPSYLDRTPLYDWKRLKEPEDTGEVFLRLLSSPNLSSREWIYRQYDYMVRNNTVILPGSDAAVMRVKGTTKGLALTIDGNGRYCHLHPHLGGELAVAEAARNVVVSGAKPLAITDGLNFGSPEKEEIFWQFSQVVSGIETGCRKLGIPVVSGNVSFYNETGLDSIYPTPIIGMVGLLHDVDRAISAGFKKDGDAIFLLGENRGDLGGSEYLAQIEGIVSGEPPTINWHQELTLQRFILRIIEEGLIESAHDCSEGGLAIGLAEASFLYKKGIEVEVPSNLPIHRLLFGEEPSRVIISTSQEKREYLYKLAQRESVPCKYLGQVGGDSFTIKGHFSYPLQELWQRWRDALPCLLK